MRYSIVIVSYVCVCVYVDLTGLEKWIVQKTWFCEFEN